jgi:hypothetical protein
MGAVYKARQTQLDRIVAIKTLRHWTHLTPQDRQRFLREAQSSARLNHPNIVQLYEMNDRDTPPFFAMEYVAGRTLHELKDRLQLHEKVRLLEKVARAVGYAHAQGVVHRDLKPMNILVSDLGEPKVMDFGIARLFGGHHPTLTAQHEFVGTPAYAAPEQLLGTTSIGPSADVYALGMILFEMITGHPAFVFDSLPQAVAMIQREDPPFPRDLNPAAPEPLQRIALKALEKLPQNRYPSAMDLADDLGRFQNGEIVTARPSLYNNRLSGKVELHLQEIRRWKGDNLIDRREEDRIERSYRHLIDDEPQWLGGLRQIRFEQILLHLGGLLIILGSGVWMVFNWSILERWERVAGSLGPCLLLHAGAVWLWKRQQISEAISLFLSGGILFPVTVAILLSQYGLLGPRGPQEVVRDYFSNSQQLVSSLAGLAYSLLQLRILRSSAFASLAALMTVASYGALMHVLGIKSRIEAGEWAAVALHYLPLAPMMLAWGLSLERWERGGWTRPFYALGLLSLILSITLLNVYSPSEFWKLEGPHLDQAQKMLFMASGVVYFALGFVGDRRGPRFLRPFAYILLLLTPPSILIPLHSLHRDGPILFSHPTEPYTLTQFLLPAVCLGFSILSVPLQIRTFLYSGFAYLAIWTFHFSSVHLQQRRAWPLVLMLTGAVVMSSTLVSNYLRRRFWGTR